MKATLLKVTGETVEISPVNGNCFTLNEAQSLVIMIMNEEGKFHFELNVEATRIALMNSAIFPDDYIAGDAIVCDDTMF